MTYDPSGIPTGDVLPPFDSETLRNRTDEPPLTPEFNPTALTFWCIHCPAVPHRTDAPQQAVPRMPRSQQMTEQEPANATARVMRATQTEAEEETGGAEVVDLVAALRASIEAAKKRREEQVSATASASRPAITRRRWRHE